METTTPPPNPAAGAPLVEYVRTQRQNAAYGLIGLAVLLLALTVFLGLKAFRAQATPEKPADKPLTENPLDPDRLEPTKPTAEVGTPQRTQYMFGWVGTLMGCAVAAGCGIFLLVGLPATGEEKQRAEARILLLAVGGLLGALLIIFGMAYFYLWSDSLGKWIDKRDFKEARWVLIPLLMILAGAGLMFAAIQPARAEERNNSLIRRLVYGSNFGLTALLLVVMLVVVNVLIAREVPNKLDTTSSGFYSLSNNTKALLTRLDQPVKAYAVIPEAPERLLNDIRQLLIAFQENSDGNFTVRFLSQVGAADKKELADLRAKYPKFQTTMQQRTTLATVLLTVGEEGQRHTVLSEADFSNERREFAGEATLYREVSFLADSQNKPVVYFTQGHNEMDISGGPAVTPRRSVARLKEYLEKNYLDIRPLTLSDEKTEIPGDATMIVIVEPRVPFSAAAVDALRKYMTNPTKKGKLIFLSGAVVGPDRKIVKTGLEPLLSELNVRLGSEFLFNVPDDQVPDYEATIVTFHPAGLHNPLLLNIATISEALVFYQPRLVEPAITHPELQATELLATVGSGSWLEEERPQDLGAAFRDLLKAPVEVRKRKQVTRNSRTVAVTVSERSGGARAAVFGSSLFISDEIVRAERGRPFAFTLIGTAVDWLRDKQTSAAVADIEAKKYTEYTFPAPATVDFTRLIWLPLGLALLTVVGLGAGVWVIRRR